MQRAPELAAYLRSTQPRCAWQPIWPRLAIENVTLFAREREKEEQLRQSQKMEGVGKLAGGVAHDFNNLLTAITGYSELSLRCVDDSDRIRRNFEEIKKAGDRAAALTRQLLAFSRKQVLQPKIIDLNAVIVDLNKMLRRLIGEDIDMLLAVCIVDCGISHEGLRLFPYPKTAWTTHAALDKMHPPRSAESADKMRSCLAGLTLEILISLDFAYLLQCARFATRTFGARLLFVF